MEVTVSVNRGVCHLEWLKAASVKKLLLQVWGTWKCFFRLFLNLKNSETSQRKTQEMYICFRFLQNKPAESSLLKPSTLQIGVVLVTVPLELDKILLQEPNDSFPSCVVPCIFKAVCRGPSASCSDWCEDVASVVAWVPVKKRRRVLMDTDGHSFTREVLGVSDVILSSSIIK